LTDLERRRGQTVAAQRQAYSARGVSLKGSPLLVLAETNELAARDAGRVQTHTTTQAYELRRAGTFAQQQSQIRAAGMGLSTVADVGGNVASGLSLGPASSPSVSTPLLRGVGSSRFGSSMPSYSVARFGE
jgi:hypothetical protein